MSAEMALSSAWCAVLPLWLLCGAACSRAASGDGSAFRCDMEGSSAFGRLDPPETSEPRVAPGSLPPAARYSAPAVATLLGHLPHVLRVPLACSTAFSFPPALGSFTCTRSVQKLEIKSFTLYFRFGLCELRGGDFGTSF